MSHHRAREITWPHVADNGDALTYDEGRAILALQALGRSWPKSLKLVSMGGVLHVVHDADERFHDLNSSSRGDSILSTIHGIPNDGGDW